MKTKTNNPQTTRANFTSTRLTKSVTQRAPIYFAALFCFTLLGSSALAQLTGTKTIPGDYPTIFAAVTDLNTQGVGAGGVTFNVAAGYTEALLSRINLTATGTAANPIVFQKSGAGANPLISAYVGTSTPGSATPDGMWSFVGSDFVTIDGIDLADPNGTNNATMEYGYGLFKASATNGAQNNTIKNCTITLNRVNNATGTAPMVDGSVGIAVMNSTPTAATTVLTITSAAGSNSSNKFYTNIIQNCNIGVALIGFADVTPFTFADTNNDVGGGSAATGNQILNFGGGAVTNPAAGIRTLAQYGENISFNTINNNNGAGVNHATTLRGIFNNTAVSASATISNNTITVKSGATASQLTAIENAAGATAAGNTISINSNTITGCTYTTATTGAFTGITTNASAATVNINNNILSNNATNATSGTTNLIQNTGAATVSLNINSNNINGWTFNAATTGAFNGITAGTPGAAAALSISSNNVQGIAHSVAGSSVHTYITWTHGNSVTDTINLNTFTNLNVNTTGSVNFLTRGTTSMTATGVTNITNNSIVTGFNKGGAGGSVTFLNTGGGDTSPVGAVYTETGNNFSNITLTGATAVVGWSDVNGPSGSGVSKTITGNTFSNISTGSASVTIIAQNFGGTSTVSNNTISNVTHAPTATGLTLTGISIGSSSGGATFTVANNAISGLSSTGTGAQVVGILGGSTSITTFNINSNTVSGISSTSTAGVVVSGIFNSTTGATTNIFKNKVYDVVCSPGATIGINSTAAAATNTINVYNNIVGRLYATTSTFFQAARGLLLQGTVAANFNVFYNTVYLDGTTPGQTYCVYVGSTVNSVPNVNAIDNIFVNNVTSSNGATLPQTVYFRFGTTTSTDLASTTNNNLLYAGPPAVDHLIYVDGAVGALTNPKQAIGDYKAFVTPREGASATELPPFLNVTNGALANYLHIDPTIATQVESGGTPITSPFSITDDFDGNVRNGSTPDIGADEFSGIGIDLSPPNISYTPLSNTVASGTRSFTPVTATDATGVNTTAGTRPRVYYKKTSDANNTFNDNTNGTVGWKFAEASGAGGSPFSFTIDYSLLFGGGGVTAGDTIQYFVVAQDTVTPTPNVGINSGTFTATPTSVALTAAAFPIGGSINSYSILPTIGGTKTVGAGGGFDYLDLTSAIAALNSSVIASGGVVFELQDSSYTNGPQVTESFPLTINANSGSSMTNTVTFRPKAGQTVGISGSATTALFILNGADWIIFDGSNNGSSSRDLTITNTSGGASSAVIWLQSNGADGATNNTIKNVNLVGTSNITTLFGVGAGSSSIGTSSFGTGNNSNTFQNNNISKTQFGIYSQGASAASKNTGNIITANLMNAASPNNVQLGGIVVGFEDGIQITNNNISNLTTANTLTGIAVGFSPTSIGASSTTGNEVTNATITGNFIGSVVSSSSTGFSAMGISVASAASGTTTIANNMISGVSAQSTSPDFAGGIFSGGGTGTSVTRIYYNSVSMTGTRLSTTTFPSYALAINGTTPTVDVRDNILFNTQSTSGTGQSYAIGLGYTSTLGNYANLISDKNVLFTSGVSAAFSKVGNLAQGSGTNKTTLAAWQTETGRDASSISSDPLFISLTNPHLQANSPAIDVGTVVGGILVDIDGDTRPQGAAYDIGADEVVTYTITASAGANGSISPSGAVSVFSGANQSFTITPNVNYHVADVLVDGVSVGAVTSYMFTNVTANHTIAASFAIDTYTITASAGANGSIAPSGAVSVNAGDSQSFTITPNVNYHVADVLVDGVSVGAVTNYMFTNVLANHTIAASFAIDTYTITASAGANGSISPSGAVSVNAGDSQSFTITPNVNYHVADVLVDGVSVGAVTNYMFTNVLANHTIAASFAIDTVTLAYNGNGNTGGTAPMDPNSPYNYNSTVTVLGPGSLVRANYTFSHWNTAANDSGTSYAAGNTFSITANTVLYAQWTPNAATTVYVDASWSGVPLGQDPDGGGPATAMGYDAFATIQGGIDGVASGGTVIVNAGTYTQTGSGINLNKSLSLLGPNAANSPNSAAQPGPHIRVAEAIITGAVSPALRISLPATNVTIQGFEFDNTGVIDDYETGQTVAIRRNIYSNGTGGGAFYFLNSPASLTIDDNYLTNMAGDGDDSIFVVGNWNGTSGTALSVTNNVLETSVSTGMNLSNVSGMVTGNRFTNLKYYAILLANGSGNITFSGNTFDGITNPDPTNVPTWGAGIRFYQPAFIGTVSIKSNLFENSYCGVGVRGVPADPGATIAGQDIHVNFNSFINNTYGISDGAAGTLDTENNWWGCNFGPGVGGTGCSGTANGIFNNGSGTVDADPWIVLQVSASPNTITPGGMTTVTADMTHNSANAVPSATMFIPDTGVAFAATEGTMNPTSGTVTSGQEDSTFTSTSNNSGTSSATVNSQTISTPITVTGVTFTIEDVVANEGNMGTTMFTFTVTKHGTTALSSTVDFQTQDGTATLADNDYVMNSGTVTFGPSDTTMPVTVLVNGDTKYENDETFTVELSNPTVAGQSVTGGVVDSATGTITNDDNPPSFAINSVAHNEGDAGTTSYIFTVSKTGSTALGSTVNFTTQDGSATLADNDYQMNSGMLTFGAADTMMQITVLVNGDTTVEPNETFNVHLSGAVGATISGADGTGTITNDDSAVSFSINDVTQAETNAGQTAFTFTVTKTGNSAASVDFQTQNGTATAGSDYVANNGTLVFGPTDTTMPVTVMVNGDTTPEPDETFTVHLLNATNGATISDADGLGTITNDDGGPAIVYVDDDWSAVPAGQDPDGAGPATSMGFDAFATISGGVNGVANPGTVIVRPGTYTDNISTAKTLTMKGAQFGVDARGRVVGSPNPAVESVWSPTTASTGTLILAASTTATTVDGFAFTGGTSLGVIQTQSGSDYSNLQISNNHFVGYSQSAVFMNRGGNNITIDKNVMNGSNIAGSGQAIFCNTQNFNGLWITNNNIVNNAGRYGFFVDSNHTVGESATRAPKIDGNLFDNGLQGMNLGSRSFGTNGTPVLGAYGGYITNNTFSNHTANGVQAGIQHVLVSGNTFSNNATDGLALTSFGNTGADRGAQNSDIKSNYFTGNSHSGLFFSGTQATGTIGTNHANFNRIVGNAVGIQYGSSVAAGNNATIDIENNWWGCNFGPGSGGTGCSGTTNGTLVFAGNTGVLDANPWIVLGASASPNPIAPGGMTTVTADMTHNSDNAVPSGTMFVPNEAVAFAATQGTIAPPTGTITNGQAMSMFTSTSNSDGTASATVDSQTATTVIDVTSPTFTINNVTQAETNSGQTMFVFTVTKTGSTPFTSTVDFQTQDGTATVADNDYVMNSGTLTFGPTDTTMPVTVLVNGDTKYEHNETFTVELSNPTVAGESVAGGVVASGTGTITNDDSPPSFAINDVTMNEGNSGPTSFVFTVTKTGSTGVSSTVNFQTMDGTATLADNDYQMNSGMLTFGPTDTMMQITVLVNGDTTVEPNETFTVELSGAVDATITDGSGLGTITNDDVAPPSVVYVDDDWTGLPNGVDPDGGGPATAIGYDAFATIQGGVNGVANPGTVIVYAGNYLENPTVNKALNIMGPNAGIPGSSNARVAEALVRTVGSQNAVFTVTSNNVTINGFSLDGDDPGVTGVTLGSGEDTNTSYAVRPSGNNHIVVRDNIIKRVAIGFRGDGASQNNLITENWFDSVGFFDFGYAVSLRTNYYADVVNNLMTRVWTGLHTNNFSAAGGPATWVIQTNEIHSYAAGILYWLQYGSATSATFDNNSMSAETGAVANNFGMLMVSVQNAINPTLTNNSVTGTDYGIGLTNTSTSNVITFDDTNSISGTNIAAIYLTDNLTFNPVGTTDLTTNAYTGPANAIAVTLNGGAINVASGTGVKVQNSRTSAADVSSTAVVTGTSIAGVGGKGVEVLGPMTTMNLTGALIDGMDTAAHVDATSSGANAVTLTVTNSTLSGSTAATGGGLNAVGTGGMAKVTITNSTLTGNSPSGAGILLQDASLTIGNTIFNTSGSGTNISALGTSLVSSLGFNLSSDGFGGFLTGTGDQVNTDPMLGPLKYNGGPTFTFAPLEGSPAIDHGKDIGPFGPAHTATGEDQRGFTRPVDDPDIANAVGGDSSDIGAVELAIGVHPSSASSRKTHGPAGDFDVSLPLSGPVGIECRGTGAATNLYTMVLLFEDPVTFSGAAVTSGTGMVDSVTARPVMVAGVAETQVTIDLSGVTDVQTLTVALFDVNDGVHMGDVGVRMHLMIGDATANGAVNSSDVSFVKSRLGQPVDGTNFRADITANGGINASDVTLTKSKLP